MRGNAGCSGDRQDALRWYPGPLPLADRLRGSVDDLRESLLAAYGAGRELDGVRRSDLDAVLGALASIRRIELFYHDDFKIHQWWRSINSAAIAGQAWPVEHQLMVDTIPKPAAFRSFGEWLTAMAKSGVTYREIATAAEVSPQLVSKWKRQHKPAKPQAAHLEALSREFGVPYADLHRLVHRIKLDTERAPDAELMATTTAGAEVGRTWEQLEEPMRSEFMRLMQAALDVQRAARRKTEKG